MLEDLEEAAKQQEESRLRSEPHSHGALSVTELPIPMDFFWHTALVRYPVSHHHALLSVLVQCIGVNNQNNWKVDASRTLSGNFEEANTRRRLSRPVPPEIWRWRIRACIITTPGY